MTETKINPGFDIFKPRTGDDFSNNFTAPIQTNDKANDLPIAAPFSAEQKRGYDNSALLKLKLQNRFQQTFDKQTANLQTETEDRVFQTSGGAWRVRDGGGGGASPNPEFYPNGASVSGTTLFDKQFYQYNGKWIELNANGRSSDLPENKNKPRPENIPEFDWQGWREVSASEIPAGYSADGKNVAFEKVELADNQKSAFKRYLADCNLVKDWDEVLGERLIDAATQKGAKIELVPTGEVNADGKTVFRVKISDESLAILRSEIKDYNHALARDREAEEKGRQEATRDVADMFGAVYETGRKAVEAALNTPSAILNTVFQPAASCTDKTIPSYGRVKFGESFDKACEQVKGGQIDPFPKFDTSGIKYDFRSEWMRRDINGKVDGDGIKMGEATTSIASQIAPIVVGKAISPTQPTQLQLSFPLRNGTAAKIGVVNVQTELDPYIARQFGNTIAENPVASKAYSQMQKFGTDVKLDFGKPPESNLFGRFSRPQNKIEVYMQNNGTASNAVGTMVHETSHGRSLQLGRPFGTQFDEFRAAAREFLFTKGRRPTLQERTDIWKKVHKDYWDMPIEKNPFTGK